MATPYEKLLTSIDDIKAMVASGNTDIALIKQKLENVDEMVKKHERILYRQNGTPGLADVMDVLRRDVETYAAAKKKEAEEQRKFRYSVYLLLAGVGIDIIIRIFGLG